MIALTPRALPAALAAGSGLAAAMLLYVVLAARPAAPVAPRVPMVVVATKVDETRPIAPADLRVELVPARPNGAFDAVGSLVGRVPLVAVPAGQPLLSSHLAPEGSQLGLWNRVPKGMRAITVAINEVAGVGGFVKPGRHVDVIAVQRSGENWNSHTVAQDIQVLAVAQDDTPRSTTGAPAKVGSSATLLVNPGQSEDIALAVERGSVRLVLRGPNDHTKRVLKKPAPPRPQAAAPRAAEPVRRSAAAAPAAPARPAPPSAQRPIEQKVTRVVVPPTTPDDTVEIIRGYQPEGNRQ